MPVTSHTEFLQTGPIRWKWSDQVISGEHPIYQHASYQQMIAGYDGSEVCVLEGLLHGSRVLIPLLIKDLGTGKREAYSAYGYGGVLGGLAISNADLEAMQAFLSAESIIAVFIRHSPFLNNQKYFPDGSVERNRHTYTVILRANDSFDRYLKELNPKIRWSVNFARRSELSVRFRSLSSCPDEAIMTFYKLYAALMKQKQTSSYYLFSEHFFLEHSRCLRHYCELVEINDPKSGNLIAGAFFLIDESGWIHYHLSAATAVAMQLQGMELLIASAIFRYGQQGYKFLHLGGGHALDESDGLSRFKSKFADSKMEFCCTKLVCDEVGYEAERARLPLKRPNLFLISDARGV